MKNIHIPLRIKIFFKDKTKPSAITTQPSENDICHEKLSSNYFRDCILLEEWKISFDMWYSLIYSFIDSFTHSFIDSFTHFIHSLVLSLINFHYLCFCFMNEQYIRSRCEFSIVTSPQQALNSVNTRHLFIFTTNARL
jgi:hypothetical protein